MLNKEQALIRKLWDYGHFFSHLSLEADLVTEDQLKHLRLGDPVVQGAVRSYQEWFLDDLHQITLRDDEIGHGRMAEADGDAGPSTYHLLTQPRCGVADFVAPGAATEEANWPDACRFEITAARHPNFDRNIRGVTAPQVQEVWFEWARNWERALRLKFDIRPSSDYGTARIYHFLAQLGGSILADQMLATGSCRFRSRGRVDIRQWSVVLLVSTMTHEIGHALGLGHLRNNQATMFPSIHQATMRRRGAPHESDIAAMVRLGYQRQTSPQPPVPQPPPPQIPQFDRFEGEVRINDRTYRLGGAAVEVDNGFSDH